MLRSADARCAAFDAEGRQADSTTPGRHLPGDFGYSTHGRGKQQVHTVLVVDNDPGARYNMRHPLAAAGFDVREAATGREALRLAGLRPDAIVLNLYLPDMDGLTVLRRLKADPATNSIPVILKTAARVEDGHRQRSLDIGAADYFAEPFDTQALIVAVRRALGETRRRCRG